MAYDDLTNDEKRNFHRACMQKHSVCLGHLDVIDTALTDAEKTARAQAIDAILNTNISADAFKTG